MKSFLPLVYCFFFIAYSYSQSVSYSISFDNAVHHEAQIKASFSSIPKDTFFVRMSRTSPGRYALHEFAKNVYGVQATDSKGNPLKITRPDPYQWAITGHDGEVHLQYILFANRGDGTYSQIDETNAHLNIPATFMYAPSLADRSIEIDFNIREDLGWKVATQLPWVSGNTYSAPNLNYFMDSPTQISDHHIREFIVDGQTIRMALLHNGTQEETDIYFEKIKKIVLVEKAIYGELPQFDYGTYTFLATYMPNASGDGMEHRNSTILTSTRSLTSGGMERNIGTVSHEFFHAWNVERIRPTDLKPFDFEQANMSGSLWFAEGFTSYYTNLVLCRAGLISPKKYVEGLSGTFNYVWNSPARHYFNPIEMSYQAPFVDAATSVDPVNRDNTFISYYSYGSVLGLALDLSLRKEDLNLDDFMKLIWDTYGKTEKPYTISDLHESLNKYAGKTFGDTFFNQYIYASEMPNYDDLFNSVGVVLKQNLETPYFGAYISINEDLKGTITRNTKIGSPAYEAGLEKGDVITAINGKPFEEGQSFGTLIKTFKVDQLISVDYERFGQKLNTSVVIKGNPNYSIHYLSETHDESAPTQSQLEHRKDWLWMK